MTSEAQVTVFTYCLHHVVKKLDEGQRKEGGGGCTEGNRKKGKRRGRWDEERVNGRRGQGRLRERKRGRRRKGGTEIAREGGEKRDGESERERERWRE